MNQRLKELMLSAGYAAPELAGRAQVVSKLIVEECIQNLVSNGYDDAALCLREIHFGVEE